MPEQQRPAPTQTLIDYAIRLREAEAEASRTLAGRGRLVIQRCLGLAGFLAAVLYLSPYDRLAEMFDEASVSQQFLYGMAATGVVLVLIGLMQSLLATIVYLNHHEDESRNIFNRTSFSELSSRWFRVQPSADHVRESYLFEMFLNDAPASSLLQACSHRRRLGVPIFLAFRIRLYVFARGLMTQGWQASDRTKKLLEQRHKADQNRPRERLAGLKSHLLTDPMFHFGISPFKGRLNLPTLDSWWSKTIASMPRQSRHWGVSLILCAATIIRRRPGNDWGKQVGVGPTRGVRGATAYDRAYRLLAYIFAVPLLIWYLVPGTHIQRSVRDGVRHKMRQANRIFAARWLALQYYEHYVDEPGNPSSPVTGRDFYMADSVPWSWFDLRSHVVMNPKYMAVGQTYYMQLSEGYAAKRVGTADATEKKRSGRRGFKDTRDAFYLDRRALLPEKATEYVIGSDDEWRVFVSEYVGAQQVRTSNWNLHYRVKQSERLLRFGAIFIVLGVVIAASVVVVAVVSAALEPAEQTVGSNRMTVIKYSSAAISCQKSLDLLSDAE